MQRGVTAPLAWCAASCNMAGLCRGCPGAIHDSYFMRQ